MSSDIVNVLEQMCDEFKDSKNIIFNNEFTKSQKNKYGDCALDDLVKFLKIERLYDLNMIDDEEKNNLIKTYNDFKLMKRYLKSSEANSDYMKVLEALNSYGILDSFDYVDAIICEVDKNILKRKLKH